jgi:ribonuclease HII
MKLIIGADEAGRGAWAGPLVAAAVCLKAGRKFNHKLLRDSKKLSPQQREEVFAYLQEVVEIGVGIVSSEEIDRVGLQRANVMAVEHAISHLRSRLSGGRSNLVNQTDQTRLLRSLDADLAKEIVVDYIGAFKKYTTLKENYSLHKFGESKFPEIAAASIIAKVTRDRMMVESAKEFSHYGFELHKGYGTRLHQKQLKKYGVTEIHRKTFGPIRELKTKKSKVKTET